MPPEPIVHRPPAPLVPPTPSSDIRQKFGYWQGERFIPMSANGQPGDNRDQDFMVDLEPPTPDKLFTLRGEEKLKEFIEQEYRKFDPNTKATFPPASTLVPPGVVFTGRQYPASSTETVPAYLCHQPLYFEEKNSERYGWEMGVWQPIISAANFYKDLAFLPYKMGAEHPCSCVTNAGKCLPGDCVPYILYVSPFSWKGVAYETGTIIGGAAVIP